MLWIEPCTVLCIASLGGLVGGCLIAITQKYANKFNMEMMEEYWISDIRRLESMFFALEEKISTISVEKPVRRHVNKYYNKGYRRPRHFSQRG